ncbi:MAG: MucR family transcriptional regulator [Magnetococcales bacterium]|nr:MucR family transcriptional regulator [Magnetococcales bacterium]
MASEILQQTVDIVVAYLKNNEMAARSLPSLIKEVYTTLQGVSGHVAEELPENLEDHPSLHVAENGGWIPKVPLEDAVTRDEVVCLICGKRGKSLRGHLTRSHKMRQDEYLKAFNLPKDFRLVAPSYSEKRRQLAMEAGLGDKLRAGSGGPLAGEESGAGVESPE